MWSQPLKITEVAETAPFECAEEGAYKLLSKMR